MEADKANSVIEKPEGLALLRVPFPPNQISKLPKPYNKDSQKGKCSECGGYHGLPAVHLDYVGHAALTDRLLDADPNWSWEPLSLGPDGLPLRDKDGGMWIKLTVCGVTRLGYGDSQGKTGPNAVKEIIGDALRNAAMRFGAALDLWHKGDLHEAEAERGKPPNVATQVAGANVKPNADAEKNVTPEQKQKVDKVASEIIDCFEVNAPNAALEAYDEAALVNEEKLYLWTLLDSKMRNTLKKLGKEKLEAKMRELAPTQA
jgi:hypothetical protein